MVLKPQMMKKLLGGSQKRFQPAKRMDMSLFQKSGRSVELTNKTSRPTLSQLSPFKNPPRVVGEFV